MHQLEDASVDAVYSLKCTLCWMGACCRPTQSTSTVTKIASGIVTPRATDAACGSVSPHRGDGGGGSPTAIPGCAASECGMGVVGDVGVVGRLFWAPSLRLLCSHTSRRPTTKGRAGVSYISGVAAMSPLPQGLQVALRPLPCLLPPTGRAHTRARRPVALRLALPPRTLCCIYAIFLRHFFFCAKSSAQQRPHLA